MPCEPYREILIDHVADELSEEEKILLEQHLVECNDCAAEEGRLRETIEATAPADAGEVRRATEDAMLAAFREQAVAAGAGHDGREPANGFREGGDFLQKIGRPISFIGALRRPMPSYATVLLLIAAVATGFWAGRSDQRDSPPRGSHEPMRPAIHQPVRDAEAVEDALAVVQIVHDDSLARDSADPKQERSAVRFATTPSDAIGLERVSPRDTL